jgi:hypothetical protein
MEEVCAHAARLKTNSPARAITDLVSFTCIRYLPAVKTAQ